MGGGFFRDVCFVGVFIGFWFLNFEEDNSEVEIVFLKFEKLDVSLNLWL